MVPKDTRHYIILNQSQTVNTKTTLNTGRKTPDKTILMLIYFNLFK